MKRLSPCLAVALAASWSLSAARADIPSPRPAPALHAHPTKDPRDTSRASTDRELTVTLGSATLSFVRVPQGRFVAGSAADEVGREGDESRHEVTLSRDFYVGKTPVTRGQYAVFVASSGYRTEAERGVSGGFGWNGSELVQQKEFTWRSPGFPQTDAHPVVLVTYADAVAFARWATAQAGRTVRLPTEAEHEYAARAGTTTPWYGATDAKGALALGWFKENAGAGTHPVATKRGNAFGLFDMAGNVFQWCADVYGPYPAAPSVDPVGRAPAAGEPVRRVLRGGSWLRDATKGRSAARYRNTAGSRNADNGFRVVLGEPLEGTPALTPTPPGALPVAPAPLATRTAGGTDLGTVSVGGEAPLRLPMGLVVLGGAALTAAGFGLSRAIRSAAAKTRAARRRRDEASVTTRVGVDGFTLVAPSLPPGSRVRYACLVAGVPVSDVVSYDGGPEMFVFTGGRPDTLEILEVAAVRAGLRGAAPQEESNDDDGGDDDDDAGQGPAAAVFPHPRAY